MTALYIVFTLGLLNVLASARAHAVGTSTVDVAARFARARTVRATELAAMHYQRIDCGRRVFAADGRSVEGDANLKVTRLTDELAEVEFPSTLTLLAFDGVNPFGETANEFSTATSRRLLTLKGWTKGQTLAFTKTFRTGGGGGSGEIPGEVEVRVLEDGYPPTYVVREIIRTAREVRVFYICK